MPYHFKEKRTGLRMAAKKYPCALHTGKALLSDSGIAAVNCDVLTVDIRQGRSKEESAGVGDVSDIITFAPNSFSIAALFLTSCKEHEGCTPACEGLSRLKTKTDRSAC